MADKMLDDDDIIDLTDLLEEGDTSKKSKAKKEAGAGSSKKANEPDSFDLGKEISMEYDVSVEEIEHGGEAVDIDASLSANEEIALSEEKEPEEAVKISEDLSGDSGLDLDEPARKILEEDAAPPVEPDLFPGKKKRDTYSMPEDSVEKELDFSAEEITEDKLDDQLAEPDPIKEDLLVGEEVMQEESKPASPAVDRSMGRGSVFENEPYQDAAPSRMTGEDLGELKQEIPGMVEAVVTPLISELVKEIIAATREQLPGIVEKVIREEIEKLKKLD